VGISHLLVSLAFVAALALSAGAAVYYVDQGHPSASDGNPGTEALPWLTVDKGANTAIAGDTVLVKAGIYREAVSPSHSGTAENPITLKGAPGETVILSGADEITGWTVCTPAIAKGNPHYAHIYYVDIAWAPGSLHQDVQPLEKAKEPNVGWWVAGGGTETTLIDSANLTQADDFWNGAQMFIWILSGTSQTTRTIVDFDAASHTLTFDSELGYGRMPTAGADRYFLLNKVEILDREGEWAVEDLGGGTYRCFVWHTGTGSPNDYLMEGTRRSRFVVEWGLRGYWHYEDLEIRHGAGHGIGCWSGDNPGHIVVQNCSIHHNDGTGIYGRYNENGIYRRNYVAYNNGSGITVSDRGGILIEENEVAHNKYDGVITNGIGTTVRRNYIHHHYFWGHPDNLQTWGGHDNQVIEENLILCAGQSFMMEGCRNIIYRGNVIVGSDAYMLIFGHDTTFDVSLEHNTMCFPGYGMMSMTADGYHYKNNIFYKGHDGSMWGATSAMDYSSDYNVFYHGPGIDGNDNATVVWNSNHGWNHDQYVAASGHDTHSAYGDPLLANFPKTYHQGAFGTGNDFRTNRLYYRNSGDSLLLAVGDKVEVDFDGVIRTITAVNTSQKYVDVDPPDDRIALKYGSFVNWKDATQYDLHAALSPGSPAMGRAHDGTNAGASINVRQFMIGDFTGDWVRDIPAWTSGGDPSILRILQWQTTVSHGPSGDIATALANGYVESRHEAISRLRITFSRPLDPATVTTGSLAIAGEIGGDLSSMVSTVTLESADVVMVVHLSSALPDGDRYTLSVNASVAGAGGEAIEGATALDIAVLTGDVNASSGVGGADVLALRGMVGQTVDAATARFDVDRSGAITGGDLLRCRAKSGSTLP
jgi:parallel beta helix pectate lyase-like protein